ncbi:MAG: MFS transporter [Candidatus Rokubacteria bacterium]|nr:MFS transporter [Candidatus Rokubacteria bacterium]
MSVVIARAPSAVFQRAGAGAWRVVVATFVTLGLAYGFWYAYSVFLVAFLREFGWSRSVVAGAFSLLVVMHGVSGPPLGWLVERFGARAVIATGGALLTGSLLLGAHIDAVWQLYVVIGVLAALGVSAAGWVPSVVLIRAWFPTHVGTALGIASAGIGVGIFALVPITQLLIDAVGWRWALRVLAAMVAVWVIPATLLLVRNAGHAGAPVARPALAATSSRPHWAVRTVLRSWRFWMTGAVFFAGSVATQMLLVHQVAYLVDHGASALVGATLVGVVGIASIVGKTGWGTLSDRVGREPTYTLAFACVALSVLFLALAGAHPHSPLPYAYAILIGVGYAVTAPLTPAIASDLFGGPRFPRIFGLLHFMNSLGGAAGPWIAGWLFDRTGSYALALPIAAGTALLAPALLWVVAPRRPNPAPRA